MELEWEEPPVEAFTNNPSGFYSLLAQALREKPGEWAIVPRKFATSSSAQATAGNIRRGKVGAMPKGKYEAVASDTKIWVRYVGDGSPAPDSGDEPTTARQRSEFPARVRAWAREQGETMPDRGRLPDELVTRYEQATNDIRPWE